MSLEMLEKEKSKNWRGVSPFRLTTFTSELQRDGVDHSMFMC